MIWLSENLDCFIAELSSSLVENSTSDPDYLQGVLPVHPEPYSVPDFTLGTRSTYIYSPLQRSNLYRRICTQYF